MPLGPYGGITLDGIRLSTDPETYQPVAWQKRGSVHQTLGGGVVIQDFGVWAKDNTITIEGGRYPLSDDVVRALHQRWRTAGATYPFADWLGNEYTVFIVDFQPQSLKTGKDALGQTMHLYTYKLVLRVTAITKLFGQPYSGL